MHALSEVRAEVELEVAFHEMDPMNVAWHGNYFRYFEAARKKLLELIDYDVPQMEESGYMWPVIECQCRFMRPLVYGHKIRVKAKLLEVHHRLKICYEILDLDTGKRMSRGHTVQVAVEVKSGEMCATSPEALLSKINEDA